MMKGIEINVSKIAYALYKQDWINSHTNSEMRMDAIRDYYGFLIDCQKNNLEYMNFEDYLQDYGYNGKIYACYEEFCDNEYLDKGYISELLNLPELIEMYCKDLNK